MVDQNFQTFSKDHVIFSEGDPAQFAYLVQSGVIDIVGRDGSVIEPMGPGDFFGEMAMVGDAPRSARAVVREDALCAQFSKEVIDEAMERSDFLIAALIRLLAKRLRKATAGPD